MRKTLTINKHETLFKENHTEKKKYDFNRGSSYSRGYDRNWAKCRNRYLSLNPLCENCKKFDIIEPATEVHHIIPLKQGGEKLDFSNLQSLCKSCHKRIDNAIKSKKTANDCPFD